LLQSDTVAKVSVVELGALKWEEEMDFDDK
jgi:hypothetical protein